MNYQFAIVVIFFLAQQSIAMNIVDPVIFSYIRKGDLEGLKLEIAVDPNWSKLKDYRKRSPLQLAILKKSVPILKEMLRAQVQVKDKDVIRALYAFFGIKEVEKKEPLKVFPSLIGQAREMILAASNDANSDEALRTLKDILHLFARRDDRLHDLAYLFSIKQISERQARIILKSFVDSFFFEQDILSNEGIQEIIHMLSPLESPHILLSLLIDIYLWRLPFCLEKKTCNVQEEVKNNYMITSLSDAIIEQSREIFVRIAPGLLTRARAVNELNILRKMSENQSCNINLLTAAYDKVQQDEQVIKQAIMAQESLSIFVMHSIISAESESEVLRRYRFWGIVYNTVLNTGDFMGAFSIGSALNSNKVEQKVKQKNFQGEDIIAHNFRSFRSKFENLEGKFRIPAIPIILRDLEPLAGFGVFCEVQGKKLLDKERLEFYATYQKNIGEAYQKALLCEYNIDPIAAKILEDLPPPGKIYRENETNESYKVIWPESTHTRRNSLTGVIQARLNS